MPPVNETFGFDDAGNRQSSALWDYGWDGRNKLVRARTKNHNTSARGYDITFGYDAEGRRFRKNVKVYQNGVLVSQDRITFIWDGWDLIYELHQNPSGLTTLERKYVWGPDIAGGTGGDTGAGGAGGLLVIRETRGTQTKDYYPLYDGSGHVTGLTTIIDSVATLVAEYAYGPFGELIHARGPMALANPWRYATKYYDSETGLYYYGARYLDPVTGQWLSREPLGESESVNLYAYCGNDPVNNVDALGMQKVPVWQASRDLLALALQCRLITEEAADNDIIDTALLNSKLTAAGQFPIVLFGGQVYRPTIVCHGKSGGGAIEGVTRLFSIVNGQVHSSSSNADVTRKLGSGMWGNARALGKDIGNLGHLLWNDISYAAGETSGFDWGDSLMFYQSPFDAEGSRIAGQQQVYPGISSGNLLVKSGGFMTDALVTSGGGEIVAMSFRLTSRATGWSVRVAKGIGSSELGNALSGLGRNPLVRNLNTLDEFGSGAGFSGVYDVASGKFLAYPSGATRLANGGTPLNLVEQFGGHSDVNRALSGLLGSSSNKRLGFSMTLDDAGNIGVGWNSRTINLPNPSFPGHTVPEGMRQQVLDAIMQSTGRSAR